MDPIMQELLWNYVQSLQANEDGEVSPGQNRSLDQLMSPEFGLLTGGFDYMSALPPSFEPQPFQPWTPMAEQFQSTGDPLYAEAVSMLQQGFPQSTVNEAMRAKLKESGQSDDFIKDVLGDVSNLYKEYSDNSKAERDWNTQQTSETAKARAEWEKEQPWAKAGFRNPTDTFSMEELAPGQVNSDNQLRRQRGNTDNSLAEFLQQMQGARPAAQENMGAPVSLAPPAQQTPQPRPIVQEPNQTDEMMQARQALQQQPQMGLGGSFGYEEPQADPTRSMIERIMSMAQQPAPGGLTVGSGGGGGSSGSVKPRGASGDTGALWGNPLSGGAVRGDTKGRAAPDNTAISRKLESLGRSEIKNARSRGAARAEVDFRNQNGGPAREEMMARLMAGGRR